MSAKRKEAKKHAGHRNFDRSRTMHKAVCSDCGDECEVLFKPTEAN